MLRDAAQYIIKLPKAGAQAGQSNDRTMHHARAFVAAFFVLSSPSAMADDKLPNVSDEQMACAGAASQEFETANAAIAERATANGSLSIEDAIAQRRLAETFCKRWATCLVNRITEPGLRENALRSTFAGCLSNEATEHLNE
jgi:hypothetical protein